MHSASLARMSPESAKRAFAAADRNADGHLTLPEFKGWVEAARRRADRMTGAAGVAAGDVAAPRPSNRQLAHVALRAGVPFIGFGFLDNAIMLVAGDAIDSTLGAALGISVLAAAGLGNLISDVAGLGLSSSIERFSGRLGLPDPRLTVPQMSLAVVHRASSAGSAVGISIGCLLGLIPLLFIGGASEERQRSTEKFVRSREFVSAATAAFVRLDADGSGKLEEGELVAAFRRLRSEQEHAAPVRLAEPTLEEVRGLIKRYSKDGGGGGLALSEFLDLARDLCIAASEESSIV